MRFIPSNLQPSWGTADLEGCRAVFAQAPHPVSPNQQSTLLDAETPVQLREAGPAAHPRPGAGHAAREGLWAWECPAGTSCLPCVLPVCGDSGPMMEGAQCREAGGPGSSPSPAPSQAQVPALPPVGLLEPLNSAPGQLLRNDQQNKLPPDAGCSLGRDPPARLWAGPHLPRPALYVSMAVEGKPVSPSRSSSGAWPGAAVRWRHPGQPESLQMLCQGRQASNVPVSKLNGEHLGKVSCAGTGPPSPL